MRIVCDSNRIISALIKKGLTRDIITSGKIDFYTLDYVIEEVRKHKAYITKKANINVAEMELLFSLIMENMCVVAEKDVKKHMNEAIDIMKDIDINDSPILACALSFVNEGIWTEDKDFERQDRIKIWKTKDLIKYI